MKKKLMFIYSLLLMVAVMVTPALALQDGSGNFSVVKSLILAIVVGLIIALIVTGIWKGDLKSVRKRNNATEYIKKDSFKLTAKNDLFLYKNVEKRPKPQNNNK